MADSSGAGSSGAGSAEAGTGAQGTEAAVALADAEAAHHATSMELASKREEMADVLLSRQQVAEKAFAAVRLATEEVMAAEAAVARCQSRRRSSQQQAEAVHSTVASWGWAPSRHKAARTWAAAGEQARRDRLRAAVEEASEARMARQADDAAEHGERMACHDEHSEAAVDGEQGEQLASGALATAGTSEARRGGGVLDGDAGEVEDGTVDAERVLRALEAEDRELRLRAVAARQRLSEVLSTPPHSGAGPGGTDGGTDGGNGGGGGEDGAVASLLCPSCGQPISKSHLRAKRASLEALAIAAESAATCSEQTRQLAQAVVDGGRLAGMLRRLEAAGAEEAMSVAELEAEEASQRGRQEALARSQAAARALEEQSQSAARLLREELTVLVEAEREAAATVAASKVQAKVEAAAAERRAALSTAQIAHVRAAVQAAASEQNPHALRRSDALRSRAEAADRLADLKRQEVEAVAEGGRLAELQEHFGKRGVQNLLYTLALAQIESSAALYAAELSEGRLQLRLAFDDALRSVRKRVCVRKADGSRVERSIGQLSGGEWRRVGLALSLAFADFSRQRLGLSCNVLVLDEVMQHMDIDGQAAMARVLKALNSETTIVIAHGLASDALYGDFEAVDIVEKGLGDASRVRVAA